MKKIWILFLVGIFIGACSSFKKREEQLKARYEALVRTNISQQFSQMNHQKIATQGANQVEEIEFVLDSLYFQPDSGFRLKAGFVRVKIRRLSTSFNHLEQSHDTLRSQFQEEAKLTKKNRSAAGDKEPTAQATKTLVSFGRVILSICTSSKLLALETAVTFLVFLIIK